MLPSRLPMVPTHVVDETQDQCQCCNIRFRGRRGMHLHLRQNQPCALFYTSVNANNLMCMSQLTPANARENDTEISNIMSRRRALSGCASYPPPQVLDEICDDDFVEFDDVVPSRLPRSKSSTIFRKTAKKKSFQRQMLN